MAGWSLVEAMLASLLLCVGMVLLLKGQTNARAYSDFARERAAAAVLAEAQIERLRSGVAEGGMVDAEAASDRSPTFSVRPPEGPEDADGDADETAWHRDLDSSRYAFRQRVLAGAMRPLQDVNLQLRWQDRFGVWQSLRWPARLAPAQPATALLAFSPQASGDVALTRARHAAIPEAARTLGPGWLAFQPAGDSAEAWLVDARSGWVLGRCELGGRGIDELRTADVADCRSRMVGGGALLLSGEIHFDLEDSPSADKPRSSALPLSLVLSLSDAVASPAPPLCRSNAVRAVADRRKVVSYHCLVYPRGTDQRWSGRSELSGAAADLKRFRVCRYSADHDHDGHIANPEHPADYTDVDGPLTQQNFLVIRAGLLCPGGLPPDPAAGRLLDLGTLPHQPPE
ncbi:hypothetical protein H5407_14335 [Mitsuaria sp. WAJ17]|uniref:hypothetical protein n=1 Tax=Mitsuaria sp. WAJ17 TaxID=2761452 RepID=UPI0015FFB348|nr:hypothetical protein [Mitsuaria sp. WAJ17]MBB2486399.1 hypothetical protein [Mitsuaria sp. WAJ17]